jgi:hypothetical protein
VPGAPAQPVRDEYLDPHGCAAVLPPLLASVIEEITYGTLASSSRADAGAPGCQHEDVDGASEYVDIAAGF